MIRHALAASALAARAAPCALIMYVLITLVAGGLPVATAWLTKLMMDGLVDGTRPGSLVGLAAGLVAVGAVTGMASELTQYLQAEMNRATGLLSQDRLHTAVDGFTGLGRFENPRFLDRLRLALQAGGASANQVVSGLLGIGRALMTIVGLLGSLFLLSPAMTALVLVAGVPTLLAEIVLSRRQARVYWDIGHTERREFFYSTLLTSVDAAKEIRLFGIGGFLRGRMLADRQASNSARRALDRQQALFQAGLGLLAALVSGAGLLWAVRTARSGGLSVGDVAIFVAAVAGVQGATAALAGQIANSYQALLMFEHYAVVTTAGPDLPVSVTPRPLPRLRQGIELRDVWFRYSDDHPWVLRGVSLRIPHGSTLALVGLNGTGKSTIVKLLCRFYDPTHGAILWDGVDLRDVDPAALRRRIGAVFQDYMRYDITAAENIGLGDLDSFDDRARVQTAAEQAGIHDTLVTLPQGYETLLSRMFFMESDKDDPETGVVLSGGQWQRLALARAFLRDQRELMILDEPSSGLDAEAEHEIHASLRRHRGNRTSLLISHRLGTVRDADLIVVLSEGRVVERGNHHALMTAGQVYARLFTLQSTGYRTGPEDCWPVLPAGRS
ncbi:ABC transporter ATP-binding protein [Streptomyces sp. GMR22]|uniref:ABC transporter ATP-binding protein n=1 Tax=Streptomyces sp. GMR22 TaxID=2759524 RepID=UPI001F40619F|nr:ABC transporter ATP-binding protein [Streptomyces sp. GMR22]